MNHEIIIGTRGSKLALWQAETVKTLLQQNFPHLRFSLKIIKTTGDIFKEKKLYEMQTKGVFTKEIEEELLEDKIQLAVHSLKDMPVENPKGLVIRGFLKRGTPNDVLIIRDPLSLEDFKEKRIIGSSSHRRITQMKKLFPESEFENIRGNIETRIQKVHQNEIYDASIMTMAALERMNLTEHASHLFSFQEMVPAPAQGIVCIQCREKDSEIKPMLDKITCIQSRYCAEIERGILGCFSAGGCSIPLGVHIIPEESQITYYLYLSEKSGSPFIYLSETLDFTESKMVMKHIIDKLLEKGVQNFVPHFKIPTGT